MSLVAHISRNAKVMFIIILLFRSTFSGIPVDLTLDIQISKTIIFSNIIDSKSKTIT